MHALCKTKLMKVNILSLCLLSQQRQESLQNSFRSSLHSRSAKGLLEQLQVVLAVPAAAEGHPQWPEEE